MGIANANYNFILYDCGKKWSYTWLGCFKSLNFKQNKSSKNIYIQVADKDAELQSVCMFTGEETIQFKQKFLKTVQK